MFRLLCTLCTLCTALTAQSVFATTLIHAGFVFDTKAGQVLTNRTITVDEGRIVSIEAGYAQALGAEIIDLKNAYVVPGFMDMHVHLDGELDPPASYSEEFLMNSADIALRSTVYARRPFASSFSFF